jgi:hypothetical protein
MPREKFRSEPSAFLRLFDLEQMTCALDEAVVVAAFEAERLVRGASPRSGLNVRIATD